MSKQLEQIAEKAKSNPEGSLHFAGASAHTGVPQGDLEADESAGCERC